MDFRNYLASLGALYSTAGRTLIANDPAPEPALVAAEQLLGYSIDPVLREAWATSNGADEYEPIFSRPGYVTPYDFLSLEAALTEHRLMRDRASQYQSYVDPAPRDKRIASGWYQSGWLPFASFAGGSLSLICDMSPSQTGLKGQVIGFVHDPDRIVFVAQSFQVFLAESLEAIHDMSDQFLEI